MKHDDNQSYFEKRIRAAIEEINAQIRDLTLERMALERQLAKALKDDAGRIIGGVTRKNGYNRQLAEERIIATLTGKHWVSKSVLYREVRRAIFDLKQVTFRGYLSRMKNKGLVENDGRRGRWRLVTKVPLVAVPETTPI